MDIFVCYSRKDSKWRDALKPHLDSLRIHFGLKYFTDTQIKVGNKWESEISEAIQNSRFAIILVSANFLSSDFINRVELPTILDRSAGEELTILPIIVSSCRFNKIAKLAQFQTVNDPNKPLDLLFDDGEVNKVFDKLIETIEITVENNNIDTIVRSDVEAKVQHSSGDFSTKNGEVPKPKPLSEKDPKLTHRLIRRNIMQNNDTDFTDEFELNIRREFSSLKNQLSALNLWVGNTFNEWIKQDPLIYSCDVRIKNEDSILKKAKYLVKNNKYNINESLEKVMKDLVGARVLVYYPSKIISLHESIINHCRFNVIAVKVHYNEENPGHLVKNILESIEPGLEGKYEFSEETNETGYTGVHYIIAPAPVDECYSSNTDLFSCFELQVRTISQHAWSELQHRAVYKGQSAEKDINKMKMQFEVLADAVDSLDRRLDRISTQTIMTASRLRPIEDVDDFIKEIKGKILFYDEEGIKEDDRRDHGNLFISANKDQFESIINKTYEYRLQVCEFYLKSCLFKKARDAYIKNVMEDKENENYPWALLRLIETYDALAEEYNAQKTLEKLTDIIKTKEMNSGDVQLVMTSSYFSWKYKNLKDAIVLGDMILNLTENISEIDLYKAYINGCYYKLDLLRKNKKEQNLMYENQQELINTIESLYNEAISIKDKKEIELNPDQLDCMAFFEYMFAEIKMENKDYKDAEHHNERAMIFIENCFSEWKRIQVPMIEDQLWSKHRLQILAQKNQIKWGFDDYE